jgi:hypothetical protein
MGIFTELGLLYAKFKPEKLMEHLKLFGKRVNIPRLIRVCEEQEHWKELVYLYIQVCPVGGTVSMLVKQRYGALLLQAVCAGCVVGTIQWDLAAHFDNWVQGPRPLWQIHSGLISTQRRGNGECLRNAPVACTHVACWAPYQLLAVLSFHLLLRTVPTALQYDKYDNIVAWCRDMCDVCLSSIVRVCLVGLALLTLLIVRLLAVLLLTVCTVLQYDEYDNAAHCMMAHSPVAWEHFCVLLFSRRCC